MSRESDIKYYEDLIKKYSTEYYNGEASISDEEFDNYVYKLSELDPNNPLLKETGWGMDNSNADRKLVVPMYGISNKIRVNYEDKIVLADDETYTMKLDGLAVQLVYKDGELVDAITRGNGIKGKSKLEHFKKIVPNHIHPGIEVVSGEVLMDYDTFKSRYDEKSQHPRNIASGIVNRVDTDDMELLTFIAYRVLKYKPGYKSSRVKYMSLLSDLLLNGFNVVQSSRYTNTSIGDVISRGFVLYRTAGVTSVNHSTVINFDPTTTKVDKFKCDGLVFSPSYLEVDDNGYVKYENIYCRKVDNEYAITKVVGVDWSMGSTGRYVPTVLLDPVNLGGCTIKRATANNYDWAKAKGLGIGSTVKIIRSGEIIPKIIEVVDSQGDLVPPSTCKYCGSNLVKSGVDLCCINTSCEGLLTNRLHRFFESFGYGVKGIGYRIIDDIIKDNNIQSIDDIFQVNYKQKYNSGSATDAKIIKLFDTLKTERTVDYFLVGVSIPKLSWKTASYYTKTNLCKLLNGENVEVVRPKGTNKYSLEYIMNNLDELRHLYAMCNIKDVSETSSDKESDTRIKVCVTGKLYNFNPRTKIYEDFSDKIVESGIRSADYLLTNTPDSNTSKNKLARKLGVKVISEEQFLELMYN